MGVNRAPPCPSKMFSVDPSPYAKVITAPPKGESHVLATGTCRNFVAVESAGCGFPCLALAALLCTASMHHLSGGSSLDGRGALFRVQETGFRFDAQ